MILITLSKVHQAEIVVAAPLVVVAQGPVEQAHHLLLHPVPQRGQHVAGTSHQGGDDHVVQNSSCDPVTGREL